MKGDLFLDAAPNPSQHYSESSSLDAFLHRPEWQERAACRGQGPAMFFPDKTGSAPVVVAAQVKAICAGCEVNVECLEYALQRHEYGFWAGKSEKQRKHMRRTQRLYRGAA